MVVTRRGVRVSSPNQTNLEQASNIQATPSTGRRTRSGASQAANSVKTSSRLREDSSDSPTPSLKRCSRAFRLHSPEQPCTPVSAIHEADVSDLDSCSSVTFNADQPEMRSRAACKTGQEESELGSCAPKNARSTRRSAPNKRVESLSSVVSHSETPAMGSRRRSKRLSITLNSAEDELSDADSCFSLATVEKTVRSKRSRAAHNVDPVKTGNNEAESSSLPTESQRATRSQKRSTRSSAKAKEFDLSDASSFTSEASPASQSTIRRSARTRKVGPIPLNLDETSTSSSTPSRRTTRRTAAEKSCDSEGFESGSDYTISAKRLMKTPSSSSKNAELDSEQTDGHSTLVRAGSGSSLQHVPMKGLWVVLETSPEGHVLHDSMLETTVVAEDADCTLLEEEKQVSVPSTEAAVNQVKLADPNEQEVLVEAAMAAPDQQHERSAEKQDEDDSAVEKMEAGSSPSEARCEDVGGDDVKDVDLRTEVSGDDQVFCGSVSTTQEQEDDMEVEQVTCQEVVMEITTEDKDVREGKPEEAVVSVDERVTPDECQLEDAKATEKTSTSHSVVSRGDEEMELEEEDIGETQGHSGKPEEIAATVVEETTFKKSPLKDMKRSKKTKTISLLESGENKEDEDIFDHQVEDTEEQQGPSRKPEKEKTPKKSPLKDMKASQKTKKISLLETEEDEDISDHQVEDTEEQQGPSRKPEKEKTPKKSPLKDMKTSQKTKKISLLETEEDEDISDHQVEDTEEQQGPSRKPEKEKTPKKSPLKDMKASQKTKKISLLETEEDEDISDHKVEDTEEQQGPSRKPEKEKTPKKSPLKDMKASQKTKKISLLETEEDEDISDHKVEDTEEQQGPSRKPEKETRSTVVEETTFKKSPLKDMKDSKKTKTISLLESSEDKEDEDISDHEVEDTEEQQGPSRKPEKETTATVVEETTFKKSPLKDMKASQKTKKVSLLESSEDEEDEDIFDHQVEDTNKQQGPSRKPKKETTFTKSPFKDMKASQKTKIISLLESSEDEEDKDISDHQVEDTEEQQDPSRTPKKETTFKKSPLKDMKASQKTKKISLLDTEENEDIFDHQVKDREEQQDPSRRPKKKTPFKKSPLKDMKASQNTKKISLLDTEENEDILDHQVEDTEEQQDPFRRPKKKTTFKKSLLKDMKASQKTKKISLLESSEDEEDEDIFDHQVEDTEKQQGPSRRPKKKTFKKSPLKDMKASQKTKKISLLETEEDEDIFDHQVEDTEKQQASSRRPKKETTFKKSPLKDMKASQKTKKISLLESSEDEEDEDIFDDQVEDREEQQGPSRTPEKKKKKKTTAGVSVDGLFMVDARPGQEVDEDYYTEHLTREELVGTKKGEEEDDEEFVDEEAEEDDDIYGEEALLLSSRNPSLNKMSSRIDPGVNMKQLGGLYITFDGSKSKPSSTLLSRHKKKDQNELMKKSVIGSDFEKKEAVPPYTESKKALKLKRRVEREKTTGDAWFNMKAPELTQELKRDLKLLKMRGSMDPKRFYKKNDRDGFPKYFQVATVEDSAIDFYHSRIPKKQRKRTMVEELLADAEFRSNNKKRYQSIVAEKAAQASGKNKKFRKNTFHKKSQKVTK
nr:deoxynucleotidyltransferase terminal-interacting protein 2 isoform X1 [Syngnathus scovelli]